VVLLDEIDLHLHPMWQMHVIDDIRRLFPRMTFIVTTHNPLTLHGARKGEIFIMRRDGDRIELVQKDILPGHDVDRVLFEQFGIHHTFDRETRELIEQHRALLESGAAVDDPRRTSLENRITVRLGTLGEALAGERREQEEDGLAPWSDEERARLDESLKQPRR
jgi:hypothetical protein